MPIISSNQNYMHRMRPLYILLGLSVFVNFSGLFNVVMDPDATRYASIAKTMVLRNNFLELYSDGTDWLDKPHFPFWLTALSFKIFGFHSWSYKLPGVLLLLLGAFYVWLFAKELYNKTIALTAVLIFLTAQHIILSNNDVRAEPFLTGLIIAAVFHYYKTFHSKKLWHLLAASAFTACAIMTKGIFVLVPIGSAIAGHLLFTKDWKNLFHYRWLLAAVFIGIFILPELYALYYQFDLHAEKIVFGRTHVSGLRFFFWDSQFGRFINSGPIKGRGNPFFFFHTVLWTFLPWSVLLYLSVIDFLKKGVRNPFQYEWYCICGALSTFVLFSASQFQLPYYLNIAFPFFAILTARYLFSIQQPETIHRLKVVQLSIIALLVAGPILIQLFFRPKILLAPLFLLFILLVTILFTVSILRVEPKESFIYKTALAACFLNIYLNLIFYPSLLRYQAGSEAALWVNANNPQKLPVLSTKTIYSFEFYHHQPISVTDTSKLSSRSHALLFISKGELPSLQFHHKEFTILKSFADYPITRIGLQFFNVTTRKRTLGEKDVILLK